MKLLVKLCIITGLAMSLGACAGYDFYPTGPGSSGMHYGPPPGYVPSSGGMHYGPPPGYVPGSSGMHYGPPPGYAPSSSGMHYGPP